MNLRIFNLFPSRDWIRKITLENDVTGIALSPYLNKRWESIKPLNLIEKVRSSIEEKRSFTGIGTMLEVLKETIEEISYRIRGLKDLYRSTVRHVIESKNFFEAISESEAEEGVIGDLGAYLIINQIFFYYLLERQYAQRDQVEKLPKLHEINSLKELQNKYLKEAQTINYEPIYLISITELIPKRGWGDNKLVNAINRAIKSIRAVKGENVQHKLLGRYFHKTLPHSKAKFRGAFFTNPFAAEILANLSIDDAKEKVLDPACGSGTLLVSAYNRKNFLSSGGKPHSELLEEITGIDIMPFAIHITSANLAFQASLLKTKKIRSAIRDSLTCQPGDKLISLRRKKENLKDFIKEKSKISGEKFELEKVDTVIMNPPFTSKKRFTEELKDSIERWKDEYGIMNYWTSGSTRISFVSLSDLTTRKNPKKYYSISYILYYYYSIYFSSIIGVKYAPSKYYIPEKHQNSLTLPSNSFNATSLKYRSNTTNNEAYTKTIRNTNNNRSTINRPKPSTVFSNTNNREKKRTHY